MGHVGLLSRIKTYISPKTKIGWKLWICVWYGYELETEIEILAVKVYLYTSAIAPAAPARCEGRKRSPN